MSEDFENLFGKWRPDEDAKRDSKNDSSPEPENRMPRALNEKQVSVVGVYEEHTENNLGIVNDKTFVLLRDNAGREFRIWIARDLAVAISMALESDSADRPMTHDLLKIVMDKLGATVDRVIIDDLWQDTFYAKISVVQGQKNMEIDARPSDAIAVALRFHAPIFVAEAVLETVSARSDS